MRYTILLFGILFLACSPKNSKNTVEAKSDRIKLQEFDSILDSAEVYGCLLIYDLQTNKYYSNDFSWAEEGRLPASTFKIPNSIIALETSVVTSDSAIFKWDGEPRYLEIWEQDMIFSNAFKWSCVPVYQEVARSIGVEKMQEYLGKLDYGKMQVDSASIDLFWLEGESQINCFEQIDFLVRFFDGHLPISERTHTMVKRMMVLDSKENWTLSGKTGWAIKNGLDNGWFVGYLETSDRMLFFATNINPGASLDMDKFARIRKDVTLNGLERLLEN